MAAPTEMRTRAVTARPASTIKTDRAGLVRSMLMTNGFQSGRYWAGTATSCLQEVSRNRWLQVGSGNGPRSQGSGEGGPQPGDAIEAAAASITLPNACRNGAAPPRVQRHRYGVACSDDPYTVSPTNWPSPSVRRGRSRRQRLAPPGRWRPTRQARPGGRRTHRRDFQCCRRSSTSAHRISAVSTG